MLIAMIAPDRSFVRVIFLPVAEIRPSLRREGWDFLRAVTEPGRCQILDSATNHGYFVKASYTHAHDTECIPPWTNSTVAADANYGAHAGITFSSVLNANVGEQIHLHLFSVGVTATDITRIAGMARRAGARLSTYNTKQKLGHVLKLLVP